MCAVELPHSAPKPDTPTPERVYKTDTMRLYRCCLPGKPPACGVPGFEKATVTTADMLTWFGVNMFRFRIDPGWDKFDADYRI